MRLVVLLRGINVGGHKKVPMAALRALLEARGYADVKTYVQSGNVVVTSDRPPAEAERDVAEAIAAEFGFDVAVVVRTAEQIAEVVAGDPFADVRDDHRFHQALFLAGEPDPGELATLRETDFSPEQLVVRPGVLHAWCPNGVQNSPLLKALERVRVTATARNWRTVEKIAELSRAA
jgi:uncharacterized protein (DUF1697 family)